MIGQAQSGDTVSVMNGAQEILRDSRARLQQLWARTSYEIQALRDHPDCAREEYERHTEDDPGLSAALSYDPAADISCPLYRHRRAPHCGHTARAGC